MQNSELYRRGFVVPLTKEAEEAIINNDVNEQTEVNFFEITNDVVFDSLWAKGFFKGINNELGVMIDDYEEEIVESEKLEQLSNVIVKLRNQIVLGGEEFIIIESLERLVAIAKDKGTSIFFIL